MMMNFAQRPVYRGCNLFLASRSRFIDGVSFRCMSNIPNIDSKYVRNIGIIAHVDHGKTTLVDAMMRHVNTQGIESHSDRVMDDNVLEQERGITISSKTTSIFWDNPSDGQTYQLNIVDTPGHADFGGEVERIMSMIDGVALLADACEGPKTQTKYVLSKALKKGLKPIVVINKVDKPNTQVTEVEDQIFDLFDELGATDEQLDFPFIYTSAKEEWAVESMDEVKNEDKNIAPLLGLIAKHVEPPEVIRDASFSMLVTQVYGHPFFGKCIRGRITTGTVRPGDTLHVVDLDGNSIPSKQPTSVRKILAKHGLKDVELEVAGAGDIVAIAGFENATVSNTLLAPSLSKPIHSEPIDPPSLAMGFLANDSPTQGKDGKVLTSSEIGNWLIKEAENNVSITVKTPNETGHNHYEVYGRGEMQLGIIIETMRREGIEFCVSPPRVLMKEDEDGNLMEPVEEVVIDVDSEFEGSVMTNLTLRKGDMIDYSSANGTSQLIYHVPTRGLLGFRSEFINETRGSGVMNQVFHGYIPHIGVFEAPKNGALIANSDGVARAYSLGNLEKRGVLFISAGSEVYEGMVIGECTRPDDLYVNAIRQKEATNVRTVNKDEHIRISPPRKLSLENIIATCKEDELIEITPSHIRLRKEILNEQKRRQIVKDKKKARTNQKGKA